MSNKVIISFILKSDFGFFRKPDTNEGINLSYNVIHRPALLGILGAIVGLNGYQEFGKLPEYYDFFKDLKVGIEPVEEQLQFQKVSLKYNNTTGYANFDNQEKIPTTLNVEENLMIAPTYKVYLEIDLEIEKQKELKDNILGQKSEYIPYFGKNECFVWWNSEECEEISDYEPFNFATDFSVSTFVCLNDNEAEVIHAAVAKAVVSGRKARSSTKQTFIYFERLPTGLEAKPIDLEEDKKVKYGYNELKKFVYTNALFEKSTNWNIELQELKNGKIIQLFK